MRRTSIYIVDDSITIRAMMQALVEQDRAFDVCGLAGDAEQALDEIAGQRPDIILLDLAMPMLDGLTFLERIEALGLNRYHAPKVIVVSSATTFHAPICAEAFERGAVACFDKSCVCSEAAELLTLLHEVSEGEISRYGHGSQAVTLPLGAENDNFDAYAYPAASVAASGQGATTFI